MIAPRRSWLKVPEAAADYGISDTKVLGWIRSGELRAVNVAASRCGRPRWRIEKSELERFMAARMNATPVKVPRTRPPRNEGVIQFYTR